MDWTFFACIVFVNVLCLEGSQSKGWKLNNLMELLKRRNFPMRHDNILRTPRYPDELPPAEPILPGHTLLRPARGMLRSSIKFPLRDMEGATVYGNVDNLGITYGKSRGRVRYTNFRKNNLKAPLQNLLQELRSAKPGSLLVIELDPAKLGKSAKNQPKSFFDNKNAEEDNNGSEILDDSDELFEDSKEATNFRRKKKSKSRFRNRDKFYQDDRSIKKKRKKDRSSSSDTSSLETDKDDKSSDDSSSSIEKNPGNPFTIHKDKYKQNWIWNHIMDGDHMNVNPFAPPLSGNGPTGADLFFGRKWWYFNQDDYKPLR